MASHKPIDIIIADDHTLVRRAIVSLLSLNDGIRVLAEVGDGREAVKLAIEKRPHVALMDLSMPNFSGFEAIRQIKKQASSVKILVLSAYDSEDYVRQTIESGADGYMLKTTSPEELYTAISTVSQGKSYFSKSIHVFAEKVKNHASGSAAVSGKRLFNKLTTREREILQLIAESHSHQEIADMLHISVRTVDTHRYNIIQKLGLHDTASLVTYAIKNGIVIVRG